MTAALRPDPGGGVRPACDPRLPASFRRWVLGQLPVAGPGGELAALEPGGSSGQARQAAAVGWLVSVACLVLLISDPGSLGRLGWLVAAAVAAVAAVTIRYQASRRDLRRCRRWVIFPETLDETCRALLGRTQAAIDTIMGSYVRAAGLLGNPVNDTGLREHEWEIAGKLREITSFRLLLARNTPSDRAGPMTSDVLGAHRHAIDLALEAATARVVALESYGWQLAAADDADRDWRQALKLSELNDRYLDLVARTAADEYAAVEIAGLTVQLTAAATARTDRLREADLAATVLALPAGVADGSSVRHIA